MTIDLVPDAKLWCFRARGVTDPEQQSDGIRMERGEGW